MRTFRFITAGSSSSVAQDQTIACNLHLEPAGDVSSTQPDDCSCHTEADCLNPRMFNWIEPQQLWTTSMKNYRLHRPPRFFFKILQKSKNKWLFQFGHQIGGTWLSLIKILLQVLLATTTSFLTLLMNRKRVHFKFYQSSFDQLLCPKRYFWFQYFVLTFIHCNQVMKDIENINTFHKTTIYGLGFGCESF